MADVKLSDGKLIIKLSLLDALLAFHGSFEIPLEHITNAYVADFADLELQYKLEGTNLGLMRSAGIFSNPKGLIFVDGAGEDPYLVIETQGERIPCVAVQLPKGQDPNALAHEIMHNIPDSGEA